MKEQKRDALALAIGSANPKTHHVYIDGNDACVAAADKAMPLVDAWLTEAEQRGCEEVRATVLHLLDRHEQQNPMGREQWNADIRAALTEEIR